MIDGHAEREALAARVRAEASARAATVTSPGARAVLLRAADKRAERVLAGLPVDLSYLRARRPVKRTTPRAAAVPRDLRDGVGAPKPTTRRPCLCCRRAFDSHGPGNRLCDPCRVRSAGESPFALQL